MKILMPGALALLLSLQSYAQKDIPAFGKIDKSELLMKQYETDKTAGAVVLFDVAEVYCTYDPNSVDVVTTELERHVRIKILDKRGLEHADIKIPYFSQDQMEDIKNISAQTTNIDEAGNIVVTKVDKKLIYDKKINKRYSEIAFAFPDVKPGSIIEYKYKDAAKGMYGLKDWYFQRTIPMMNCKYIMNFPYELKIAAQPRGMFEVETTQTSQSNRYIKTFSMKNVPAFIDEPFISCNDDYIQQVIPYMVALDIPGTFTRSLLRTWPGLVKQLMEDEDFGFQLKKNIPRTTDLDDSLRNITDPYQKMVIIHNYVRKNMEWNQINGIWALDGVKSAWKDKKGTTGEINLILVNLLKDAGLKASPVLLSTRENGRVNTSIADIYQFNKVMAYVRLNGKVYVLDATNKFSPANLLPVEVLFSEGLVIEKYDTYEWGWKKIEDNSHLLNQISMVEANIDDKGVITGDANVTSIDYGRMARIEKLKEGKNAFIKAYFKEGGNMPVIENLSFGNENVDSLPLIQTIKFKHQVNNSGDYNYFTANLFSGLEENPFVADARFSDVFFGSKQVYVIDGSYTIPAGYSFDALPKNVLMRLPDTSIVFQRKSYTSGKTLYVRMELQFNRPVYYIEEYDNFHEFYKKLSLMLNEQFVYKRD